MGATIADTAADRVLTESAGLVDRGHRGRLAVTGPDGAASLDGQLSNAIAELDAGAGCAAALLTPKGKLLAEVRVLHAAGAEPELWLECERPGVQELFDALRRGLVGWQAQLHKRTLEQTTLSLIGPSARSAVGFDEGAEHDNRPAELGGRPVLLALTDLGVDIICATADADVVRAAIGVPEVDDAAAEVLRVESGRPRYGIDVDDATMPQEAGLNERLVSFTKGCYVGQETVARLHWRGRPNRHLRGLELSEPRPSETTLTAGGRELGSLASSVVSPRYGAIALALVRREAGPGDELDADGSRARVVELPFG